MFTLEIDLLSSECTRYIIATKDGQAHLFGTGKDDTCRFYAQSMCDTQNMVHPVVFYRAITPCKETPCKCGLHVAGTHGVLCFVEFLEDEYASSVLSRELWMVGSLPDFTECGVCVLRVHANLFLFELQCALKVLAQRCGSTTVLVFENDRRDPRRLYLKSENSQFVYSFRVKSATYVPVSRGCLLAIHDVPLLDVVTPMNRCNDPHYRFQTKIAATNFEDLCSYLQCAHLCESAELVVTICSKHGTIRLIDQDSASSRSRFEATIVSKTSEVTSVKKDISACGVNPNKKHRTCYGHD
jgi:hypothetical protein